LSFELNSWYYIKVKKVLKSLKKRIPKKFKKFTSFLD